MAEEDDERILRAHTMQRAAAQSSGVTLGPMQGGSAFTDQILAKSGNLRHNDSSEWAEVQKAAFADWINSTLRDRDMRIEGDLFVELVDGVILYNLLEVLSGESLAEYGKLTRGKMRIQLIANCSIAFKFLARHVKIVDIGPTDVVDANPKRVLGLIWAIFVYYEVLSIPDVKSVTDLKDKILAWARRRTRKYEGVNVTNLTTSFEDGRAFLALLNEANPSMIPFRPVSDDQMNRKKAYRLAEEHFGVPQLLNYQDARVFSYEQVMLTYLVELYNRLPKDLDRTLAMVMVYLKVSSWWRRVKKNRKFNRPKPTSSSTLPPTPPRETARDDSRDMNRSQASFLSASTSSNAQNILPVTEPVQEMVVLVFLEEVRDITHQVNTMMLECEENRAVVPVESTQISTNSIVHAESLSVNNVRVRLFGHRDQRELFSARIPVPNASEPYPKQGGEGGLWYSSEAGYGQIKVQVVKLDFQDVAGVVNRYLNPNNVDPNANPIAAGAEKYARAKAESIVLSLGFGESMLKNANGTSKSLAELLNLIDQGASKHRSADGSKNNDQRCFVLERENASLKEENERLRLIQDQSLSGEPGSAAQISEERRRFQSQLQERQNTIESLLRTQQESGNALDAAHAELDELRDQLNSTEDQRENKVYELNRALQLASEVNREHSNALCIAAKKLIKLEECVKVYKHTVKDIAKSLGETMTSLITDPMSKEELDSVYSAAMDASPDAPDAIFTLRIAERIANASNYLDGEVQLALGDVPPQLRDQLRKIPQFDETLHRHVRASTTTHSDLHRLMSSIEEACSNFDSEFSAVQIDEV
jgi:hypothetical protein